MNTTTEKLVASIHIPDVMVDLETAGTGPDAAILAIGAVAFDRDTGRLGPTFYTTINLASAVATGGQIEPATFTWWLQQDIRHALPSPAVPSWGSQRRWTVHRVAARGMCAAWSDPSVGQRCRIRSSRAGVGLQTPLR